MENRRKHLRLPISVDAEMTTNDDKTIKGLTKNISFSGVLIDFQKKPEINEGDNCKISLILQQNERIEINLECQMVHITNNLLGFKFICLKGLDGYEIFKNLLIYNSLDPEKLIEELKQNPGIEIISEHPD